MRWSQLCMAPHSCLTHGILQALRMRCVTPSPAPPCRPLPAGAYTTARTVGGGAAAFELGFHINRLASSAALMMQADAAAAGTQAAGPPAAPAAAAEAADAARLRPRVLAALRAAVRAYRAATAHSDGELKLTVLVTWPGSDRGQQAGGQAQPSSGSTDGASASDGASKSADAPPAAAAADVYVHVAPLPPRPAPPVRVVMRGQPRQNAAAKDSEWVRQRKAIEQELPPDVNEASGTLWVPGCFADRPLDWRRLGRGGCSRASMRRGAACLWCCWGASAARWMHSLQGRHARIGSVLRHAHHSKWHPLSSLLLCLPLSIDEPCRRCWWAPTGPSSKASPAMFSL